MLVEAGCDSAEVFDAIEKPFDPIAQLVDPRAEGRRIDAMIERADVGISALFGDFGAKRIAVIAAIGQQNAVLTERAEHVLATLAIVCLPFGQLERDREPVAVDDRVNFGRKPAAGTSHATTTATFFSPFAAC